MRGTKAQKRMLTIRGEDLDGVDFKITVVMRTRELTRFELDATFDSFADRVGALVLAKLAHLKDTEFKTKG